MLCPVREEGLGKYTYKDYLTTILEVGGLISKS